MATLKLRGMIQLRVSELVDYSPLVAVMHLVALEIQRRGYSFDQPKARRIWMDILADYQHPWVSSDHNQQIPCRFCDQSFKPVINEVLFSTFLQWYEIRLDENLIAIHRCPSCGGSITATKTRTYTGDFHTPEPGSIDNDGEWAENLLEYFMM